MTTAPEKTDAGRRRRPRRSSLHHRRHPGQRPREHPGHPGRRAGRRPDPAVLRPPAARAGRRLPPVPGRHPRRRQRPRLPQAAGLLHAAGRRGHGRQHPGHQRGRRQGAAGDHGVPADQPPARLPGLRQGRRVPAAEPGDVQRPRRVPVLESGGSSGPSPSRSTSPPRCCSTASAACSARAAPGSPSRSPATRSSSCSSAARCSRSASTRREPFDSYFSGNTIQICPVGALTSAEYRFRSRPFDLVSTPSVAEHDACGSAIRVDHRRGKVMRRLAGNDPEVNEEWITDKDRFAFHYATAGDRLTYPQVRDEDGELRPASWPEAFAVAARGLAAPPARSACCPAAGSPPRTPTPTAKFARVALGTNDIDFRARPLSAEEASFLAAEVVGQRPGGGAVTYADLERAAPSCWSASSPRTRPATIFLRLRKAARCTPGTRVVAIAPYTTRGLRKMNGHAGPDRARRGGRRARRARHAQGDYGIDSDRGDPGRRAAGDLAGRARRRRRALAVAHRRPAGLGAAPRRRPWRASRPAACRNLLPGGRPVADAEARVDVATAWGVDTPARAGRPRRRRDRRRGRRRRARRTGRRRRRPRRHRGPAGVPRRARGGVVRGRPRAARDRRDPRGRRRVPGRAGHRQGRHLRHLGGPPAPVRRGASPTPTRCPTCASWPASPRSSAARSASARVAEARAQMEELGPVGRRARRDGRRRLRRARSARPTAPDGTGLSWRPGSSCSTTARCRTATTTCARPRAPAGRPGQPEGLRRGRPDRDADR